MLNLSFHNLIFVIFQFNVISLKFKKDRCFLFGKLFSFSIFSFQVLAPKHLSINLSPLFACDNSLLLLSLFFSFLRFLLFIDQAILFVFFLNIVILILFQGLRLKTLSFPKFLSIGPVVSMVCSKVLMSFSFSFLFKFKKLIKNF